MRERGVGGPLNVWQNVWGPPALLSVLRFCFFFFFRSSYDCFLPISTLFTQCWAHNSIESCFTPFPAVRSVRHSSRSVSWPLPSHPLFFHLPFLDTLLGGSGGSLQFTGAETTFSHFVHCPKSNMFSLAFFPFLWRIDACWAFYVPPSWSENICHCSPHLLSSTASTEKIKTSVESKGWRRVHNHSITLHWLWITVNISSINKFSLLGIKYNFCWQISRPVLTLDMYPPVSLPHSLAGSRARVLSLKWITTRLSSARLWRRPSVGSVCHPGKRSRCWWAVRRCCALCTTLARCPASSTSARTRRPMRFGHISLLSTSQRNFLNLSASHAFLFKTCRARSDFWWPHCNRLCVSSGRLFKRTSCCPAPGGSNDAGEARPAGEQKHVCLVRAECIVGAAGRWQRSDHWHPDQVCQSSACKTEQTHTQMHTQTHTHTFPIKSWKTSWVLCLIGFESVTSSP